MRKNITLSLIIPVIITSAIFGLTSCKKSTTSTTPSAYTSGASEIGQEWAVLNAIVKPYNNTIVATFDLDTTTTYTHSVDGTPLNLSGNTSTTVRAIITGLKPGKKYYYRVKLTGSTSGTNLGADTNFTTTKPGKTIVTFNPALTYGTVSDIDNNVYNTIVIGTQTWMAENLKTTRFNDGTPVSYDPVDVLWADSAYKSYCWYNNDSVVYGAIYNWLAAGTGKLCPTGWHVPTDDEWTTLTTFIGGESTAGGILMEAGNVHWQTPNTSLTNGSGFTALPGGYRNYGAVYSNIKRSAYWWSSTESATTNAWCRYIYYNFANITRTNTNKYSGLSVRCLKD